MLNHQTALDARTTTIFLFHRLLYRIWLKKHGQVKLFASSNHSIFQLFARTYFTEQELAELRHRLDETRKTGGDRLKIRQVVQDFVNEVLDDERKLRIQAKKNELDRQFGTYA